MKTTNKISFQIVDNNDVVRLTLSHMQETT